MVDVDLKSRGITQVSGLYSRLFCFLANYRMNGQAHFVQDVVGPPAASLAQGSPRVHFEMCSGDSLARSTQSSKGLPCAGFCA
jgi:hypothetical protein